MHVLNDFLPVVAMVLIVIATANAAISIVRGPQGQTVVRGGTVIFRCTVRNKGSFKVYWFFDRDNRYLSADTAFFEDSRDPRFSIVGNQMIGEFNLRITEVRSSDAGVYRCGFVPAGTNMLSSRAARLTVLGLVPPDDGFPRCEATPPAGMIELGQRATLTCTSQGGVPPASLTWLRNGREISPTVQQRNIIERTFDSALNGVRFTCQATSSAFMGVRTCSLIPLRIDPTARVEPPQLVARPGQDAVFKCITGGPSPVVEFSWTFGDLVIPSLNNNDRFELSMDRRTLTVRQVQLDDDETSVQCTVATDNGLTATAGALLRVVLDPTNGITTLTPTTLTPDPNQTQPLPTPAYERGLGTGTIIGIIVGGIVVAQILIVTVVFVAHKLSSKLFSPSKIKRNRGESMVPSLAGWQGQQTHPVPYQGLDVSGRSASVIRYLSLHPLRAPPTRFSSADVGVYEAAVDPNTNTIVFESSYNMQDSLHTGHFRDSMDDGYNSYQPALRSSAVNQIIQEGTEEAAEVNDTSSRDGNYYVPPGEMQQLASGLCYSEPPQEETNATPVSEDESEAYELPPAPSAITKPGENQRRTDAADDSETEYYEPPVETPQQTPVMNSFTDDVHEYDVAPDADDAYEMPVSSVSHVQKR